MQPDRSTRRRTTNTTIGASACLAAVLALSACGSSTKTSTNSGGGGGGGSGTSSGRGVTADSITVGGLAPTSGTSGFVGLDVGFNAYISKVNASGGVNGRKIHFIGVQDDGGSATLDLAAARKLVEQEHVFAVVPQMTTTFGAAQYLENKKIPSIGVNYDSGGCLKSYAFSIDGCPSPPTTDHVYSPALGDLLKNDVFNGTATGKTVAVTADDTENGHNSYLPCALPLKAAGFTWVNPSGTFIPVGASVDYTPFVTKIMTMDHGSPPDAVFECTLPQNVIGLAAALRQAGYKGALYNAVTYDPSLLSQKTVLASLKDSYVYLQWAPNESTAGAVQQMLSDVKAFKSGTAINLPVQVGYWSAVMLVDMLKHAGPNLTPESFAAAANADWTFSVPGALCPVSFPLGHSEGFVGGAVVQIKNDSFSVVDPLSCQPLSANIHY